MRMEEEAPDGAVSEVCAVSALAFTTSSHQDPLWQDLYSPERLSRDQLKRLLQWNASPHVTDAMLVQAVYNRLHLRRLSMDDVAAA